MTHSAEQVRQPRQPARRGYGGKSGAHIEGESDPKQARVRQCTHCSRLTLRRLCERCRAERRTPKTLEVSGSLPGNEATWVIGGPTLTSSQNFHEGKAMVNGALIWYSYDS